MTNNIEDVGPKTRHELCRRVSTLNMNFSPSGKEFFLFSVMDRKINEEE